MPPCEEFCIRQPLKHLQRFRHGGGPMILEGGRDHGAFTARREGGMAGRCCSVSLRAAYMTEFTMCW